MSPPDTSGLEHRRLWWIIMVLTSITFGAGSHHLTNLEGMGDLKAEVKAMRVQLDQLLYELHQKK